MVNHVCLHETQGCPLHETMVQDVKRYAKKVPGVANVNVDVVWDPPWTMTNSLMMQKNYETALPQGTGNLVKQEDGSMVLANEHEQGFMVNDAIVEFWKMCNGKRKITELVDLFAKHTGMQRGQVEKEVMQLIQQLREGGLVVISTSPETPNVKFDRS